MDKICHIIIPYRNRAEHLETFVSHMKHTLDTPYKIIVVEQLGDDFFNRGKLCNVGFDLFKDDPNAYFVFHDVDMLPQHDVYTYSGRPAHLSKYVEQHDYNWPINTRNPNYEWFGGVNLFSKEMFEKINGFPNNFWGWGAEDDDILKRLKKWKIPYARKEGIFDSLPHKKSSEIPICREYNNNIYNSKYWHILDGLSTLQYELVHTEDVNGYTLCKVNLTPVIPKIKVLIPFHNCTDYIEENVASLLYQKHVDWEAFFIDDASTDGGLDKIPDHKNIHKIRMEERHGNLHNYLHVLNNLCVADPEDVICILDGDDILADDMSLYNTRRAFLNKKIVLSFGTFIRNTNGKKGPSGPIHFKKWRSGIRSEGFNESHFKAFKYKLYLELTKQDPLHLTLKNRETGEYFTSATDCALMKSFMEIAGFHGTWYNPITTYIYREHENNHHHKTKHTKLLQKLCADQIMSMKSPLKTTTFD